MSEVERSHHHIRQLEEAIADKEAEVITMTTPGFFGQRKTGVAGEVSRPASPYFFLPVCRTSTQAPTSGASENPLFLPELGSRRFAVWRYILLRI